MVQARPLQVHRRREPVRLRVAVSEPLLKLDGVTRLFGGLRAVSDLDLTLPKGALAGLIGPNGAGKTTVFNLITGVYAPSHGTIQGSGTEARTSAHSRTPMRRAASR